VRHLLDEHIPTVTVLDTMLESFGGWGIEGHAIFGKASLAASQDR